MSNQLTVTSPLQEIIVTLQANKIRALNIVSTQLTNPNIYALPPKELKTLVDITLNLEDSYRNGQEEGKNVRKLQRLIDKYAQDS